MISTKTSGKRMERRVENRSRQRMPVEAGQSRAHFLTDGWSVQRKPRGLGGKSTAAKREEEAWQESARCFKETEGAIANRAESG